MPPNSSDSNRFGLPRRIPDPIKLSVRQRCGFGCVVCGNPFVQFHHHQPQFRDAEAHQPEGITLLCASHHDDVTSGRISKESLEADNSRPWCLQTGHARYCWQAHEPVGFRLGPTPIRAPVAIMYEDVPLIGYSRAQDDEPWGLNATIPDTDGRELLKVVGNEWIVGIERYDITASGKTIEVREAPRRLMLRMDFEVDRLLHIRWLEWRFADVTLKCDDHELCMTTRGGSRLRLVGPGKEIRGDIGIHIKPSENFVYYGASASGGGAGVAQAILPQDV